MEWERIKTAAETWKALKLEEKAVNKHGKASGGRSLWHSHTHAVTDVTLEILKSVLIQRKD